MTVRRSRAHLALVGLTLVTSLGCVTSGAGERMRADIRRLRDRVEVMETRDTEINEQVARLRQVLDQATELLSRNSADIGTKVAKNETDLAVVSGQLEELRHTLDDISKRLVDSEKRLASIEQTQGKIVERVAPNIPEDKETLWREAHTRLTGGQRDEGRRFLLAFIQRFPQDPRVAQAQVHIGESYMADGNYSPALSYFQKVITASPNSAQAPDAMFLLSESFIKLRFCTDARALLNDVVKRFPRSPRATQAKARLRDLPRMMKDKNQCSS